MTNAIEVDELEDVLITWTIFNEKIAALEPKIIERALAGGEDPATVLKATWATLARIAAGVTCGMGASSFVEATDATANADHDLANLFLTRYREAMKERSA